MERHRADVSITSEPSESTVERLANAVHTAARWLPPWPDPMCLVVAAGFELVVCTPVTGPPQGRRRIGFEWHPDAQVRGLRVLRAFAQVLLREVAGHTEPPPALVDALAMRLLVPTAMLATARRDPRQPARHAPPAFLAARISSLSATQSGTFPALCPKI